MQEIAKLAVQMARENSLWGYGRIQGALENRTSKSFFYLHDPPT
jgi:hypothetical protein